MSALLDTNIVARLAQPGHPQHSRALDAIARLRVSGNEPCIVPQNLYEFWVAGTRPTSANGGLGATVPEVLAMVEYFESLFRLLLDPPDLYARWKSLVVAYGAMGKPAHDARVIAATQSHGIPAIVTFNAGDFSRYPGISVIAP